MQSTDSIETNGYWKSKDLLSEKEEIKCNNIIKQYKRCLTLMMLQKKTKEHYLHGPQISDHPYRI